MTMTATVTVHDDATPSACYPADEQERNGAVDLSVTITIHGSTTAVCDVCGVALELNVDEDQSGCDCEVASGIYSSILTPAPRTFEGSITLYRDDANGGDLGPCGAPMDGWCSSEIVALARTLTDRSRRDLLDSLESGVGTEDIEIEIKVA